MIRVIVINTFKNIYYVTFDNNESNDRNRC